MRYPILISMILTASVYTSHASDYDNKYDSKDIKVLTTKADRSKELVRSVQKKNKSVASPYSLRIDRMQRYQAMDGFGAAVTGSTCFNLMQMKEPDRKAFLKETFDPHNGYGFSYIRISIGCSDFSLSEYTCCDAQGIDNFALQSEETDYIIPILKEITAINKDIKILGSPWTAPRWMKVKDPDTREPFPSWTGGHLNPEMYGDYALYFEKWIDAFALNGIKIYAVTPQNEPLNRGNSASMFMGWKEQSEFIRTALGPRIKSSYPDVKIYAFDHNYNYDDMTEQQDYPLNIYEDLEASAFIDGAAFHNYGGNPSELLDVFHKAADKELLFTETSIGTWNDGRNLSVRLMDDMDQVALRTVNGYCKGVIVWNLMLDNDMGPNRDGGCQTCYGAVDIDRENLSDITKNSHYFIISHLSAFVRPGAVRIGSSLYKKGESLEYMQDGLNYSAFENPDGSMVLVVMNASDTDKNISVCQDDDMFLINSEPCSVTTYLWK